MWIHRTIVIAVLAASSCALMSAGPSACASLADINLGVLQGDYNPSGTFNCDANEQNIYFSVTATQTNFDALTTSWAGGEFAPVLTLYNTDTGALVAADNTGGDPGLGTCGVRLLNTTNSPNTCLDAYIQSFIGSGNYDLIVTEQGNTGPATWMPTANEDLATTCAPILDSNGNFLSSNPNCYSQYGTGNFTGDANHWGTGGSFLSPLDGSATENTWAVTISAQSPEPVTWLMGLSGILITWVVARRKQMRRGGDRS